MTCPCGASGVCVVGQRIQLRLKKAEFLVGSYKNKHGKKWEIPKAEAVAEVRAATQAFVRHCEKGAKGDAA